MPEKLNTETGEVTAVATVVEDNLPILQPKNELLSIQEASDLLNHVDSFIKETFVEGKDYGSIPGTGKGKKPLLKPGMEKLNALFGHCPSFEIMTEELDHHIQWEYEKDIWEGQKGSKTKRTVTAQAIGFFYYRVRCDLKNRNGQLVGSYDGSCSSRERGRETSPANTILKMAEKRAQMSATVSATFCSERFTVDIDGYHPTEYGASEGSGRSSRPAPKDGTIGYGKHRDTLMAEVPGGYLTWVVENMNDADKVKAVQAELDRREKEKGAESAAPESTPIPAPETTHTGDDIITSITNLEAAMLNEGLITTEQGTALRKERGGHADLESMTASGQRNYYNALWDIKEKGPK